MAYCLLLAKKRINLALSLLAPSNGHGVSTFASRVQFEA
jgi:hypothetical protein